MNTHFKPSISDEIASNSLLMNRFKSLLFPTGDIHYELNQYGKDIDHLEYMQGQGQPIPYIRTYYPHQTQNFSANPSTFSPECKCLHGFEIT